MPDLGNKELGYRDVQPLSGDCWKAVGNTKAPEALNNTQSKLKQLPKACAPMYFTLGAMTSLRRARQLRQKVDSMRVTEVGMASSSSCEVPKSALVAMAVMEVGIIRAVRPLPWKRYGGKAVSEVGRIKLVSEGQNEKAKEPSRVTVEGMEMLCRDGQLLKAALPTTSTELGMTTVTSGRQSWKAAFAMEEVLGDSVMADSPPHSLQREQGKTDDG